jgi:hypothetical protein
MGTRAPDTPIPSPSDAVAPKSGSPLDVRLLSQIRPVSSRRDQILPVTPPLAPLFPDGGLRRGTVVTVHAPPLATRSATARSSGGATTLALALLAGASGGGSWCAVVGVPDVGVVSMAELGLDLDRLALVPAPGPRWPEVSVALFDGMDVVTVRPAGTVRPGVVRRLSARVRERRAVLVVLSDRGRWPEAADMAVTVGESEWHGVETGHGYLRGRRGDVVATGRRGAVRPVRVRLWLPGATGALTDG